MEPRRFFEDFAVGTHLRSVPHVVERDAIIAFAREFDPQPFHLDAHAAKQTVFGDLVASGWQTAALSMRLFVDTMRVPGGMVGLGIDELRWPHAVHAGDKLQLDIEIVEARLSSSRPQFGILTLRNVTRNQRDEIVQSLRANAMLPRRAN